MNIIIRTDSSTQIGTGHVMRCLTLATALKEQGANCQFICREHEGNIIEHIEQQGFTVHRLVNNPVTPTTTIDKSAGPTLAHAAWLGVSQEQDAQECITLLQEQQTNWLMVDHYALDKRWQNKLRPHTQKIMVIDDLADREHDCDLLLDQGFDRELHDCYLKLLPQNAKQLLGVTYAIVRQEFSMIRQESLTRRKHRKIESLLIFMGGTDPNNDTLKAFNGCLKSNHQWKKITIVVGASYPHLKMLKQQIKSHSCVQLHIQTNKMARLLLETDLAITSGGMVTWEKCVLGVPSLVVVQDENQRYSIEKLDNKLVRLLGDADSVTVGEYARALNTVTLTEIDNMIQSSALCDGQGVQRIAKEILGG